MIVRQPAVLVFIAAVLMFLIGPLLNAQQVIQLQDVRFAGAAIQVGSALVQFPVSANVGPTYGSHWTSGGQPIAVSYTTQAGETVAQAVAKYVVLFEDMVQRFPSDDVETTPSLAGGIKTRFIRGGFASTWYHSPEDLAELEDVIDELELPGWIASSGTGAGGETDVMETSWQHDLDGEKGPMQPVTKTVKTERRSGESSRSQAKRHQASVSALIDLYPANVKQKV